MIASRILNPKKIKFLFFFHSRFYVVAEEKLFQFPMVQLDTAVGKLNRTEQNSSNALASKIEDFGATKILILKLF
jgi:hypothetical protein